VIAAIAATTPVVGPEPVRAMVRQAGLGLDLRVTPNRAALPSTFVVRARDGQLPLRGATVTVQVSMPRMPMPPVWLRLREVSPGVYGTSAPAAFTMVGLYELAYRVTASGHRPVAVTLIDHVRGLRPSG
jgi:hypothetical protein